jgi:hypothetical protein
MLFDLYNPRVIPNFNYDKNDRDKDYSEIREIIGPHSEIPRKEYSYILNYDGLRSVEFNTKPEIIALGCSLTLGQGLPQHLRWSDLLSNKIEKEIGNISYSGAAINKNVSSFFGLVNQYNYLPKILICNFANFERFYFVDSEAQYLRDWYINYSPKVTKAKAPWNYEEILPYEWVYYQNLDHIKMLETFCDASDIKLIWSCWSNALTEEQEDFLVKNFKHYIKDPVRKEFPPDFEFNVDAKTISDLRPHYKMIDWDNNKCHLKDYGENEEIFDYAYDKNKIAGSWGSGSHWPHPGVHKQIHWAEFYYQELKNRNWV